MTLAPPLVASILERPLDDTPRLIAADTLMEQGDPRGEFIMLQCRLAERGVPPDERVLLKARATALAKEHRASWTAHAKGLRSELRRGMIDELEGDAAELARHGDLFAREPITRLTVNGLTADNVATVAGAGAFARVVRLTIRGSLGGAGAALLAEALRARSSPLVSLNVGQTGLDSAGVTALAGALAGCRSLALTSNAIGDAGVVAVAKAKSLASLTTLFLTDTSVSDEGIESLARSATFGGLTRLGVARNEEITADGLRALAKSKKLKKLAWLEYTDPDEETQRVVTR